MRAATASLALLFASALWAFCHPYLGIVSDSSVYMGRVLADLDPTGVGRDMMFVHDGQSRFSLFPWLARPLVVAFGVSRAAAIIGGLGSACWFAALVALARGLASGRSAWAIVIAVSVLPVTYGAPGIFSFAETAALPRPFAEAALMAALAALLRDRFWTGGALCLLGMALHPLMALPGVAVASIVGLSRAERRPRLTLIAAGALLVPAAVLLGWLGVPLLDRLCAVVDPEWMGMLFERSPHLFPTCWPADAFPPIIAQAATLLVAARCAPSRPRRMFLAVLLVATAGLGMAAILADHAHLLLFVQVQTWRVTWLLAVVGGCAFAYCAPLLWTRDQRGRLVLAGLVLAWFVPTGPGLALEIAAVAMVLEFGRFSAPISGRVVLCIYALAGVVLFAGFGVEAAGYVDYLQTRPAGLPHLVDPLRNNLHTLPILVLTAVWLLRPIAAGRFAFAFLGLAVAALVGATIEAWDQRLPAQVYFESQHMPPGFPDPDDDRSREVLWLDARGEPWFALGRPQYLSAQQAVSMVFSRSLAMEWRERARLLVDLGLAQHTIFRPLDAPADDDRIHATQRAIDEFCQRSDAPGRIIVPILDDEPATTFRDAVVWVLPATQYIYDRHQSANSWRRVKTLAIVPCRPRPDPKPPV